MNKLLIRVFGTAELIKFRTFNINDWKDLLIKNNISSDDFIKQMHNPDFFVLNNFKNHRNSNKAQSKSDFFGENYFYGPLYNQMAIVEIKISRRKLYRGSLNKFLGTDTFFPLVNIKFDFNKIEKNEDLITICSVEETTGQVINLYTRCDSFNPDSFFIKVSDIKLGEFDFKMISNFNFINHQLKSLKTDQVIRSQWGFLI